MYDKIKTKENYDKLLASGMFWEFHPELTGNWEVDKIVIEDIDTGDWFSVGGCYKELQMLYKELQMLLDQIRELNEKKLYEGTI